MSTIHHHPPHHEHLHLWWYAVAGAVVAVALAVLMRTVFLDSSAPVDPAPADTGGGTVEQYHGPPFRQLCFAAHPGPDIELSRPNCADAR